MNTDSSSFNPKVLLLTLIAFCLAFAVVVMGAYVRISHAGISCPDWPLCYGHLVMPTSKADIDKAHKKFPTAKKVEGHKAIKEMTHRFMAGTLGLLVFVIVGYCIRQRKRFPALFKLSLFLGLLIIFQAALGAWTVTIRLMPIIVTSHLLFGFATLATLWILYFKQKRLVVEDEQVQGNAFSKLVMAGILVLLLQIFLGGWTTSNYAQWACIDFPTCKDKRWFPALDDKTATALKSSDGNKLSVGISDFKKAFTIQTDTSINYEHGNLKPSPRVAIHMTHRIGSIVTLIILLIIGLIALIKKGYCGLRSTGLAMLLVLAAQLALGVGNVLMHFAAPVAAAHNGFGALLLLMMITLYLRSRRLSVKAN